MSKFLIDVNLPRRIDTWRGVDFEFIVDINDEWTDTEIWEYARLHNLTIVSKDADFSHRIVLAEPPPRIIHIKIGNMRLRDFRSFIELVWNSACVVSSEHKLVNVFRDRIEGVA